MISLASGLTLRPTSGLLREQAWPARRSMLADLADGYQVTGMDRGGDRFDHNDRDCHERRVRRLLEC